MKSMAPVVVSSMVLLSCFAFAQSTGNSSGVSASCPQAANLIQIELATVSPWLDQIMTNLKPQPLTNDGQTVAHLDNAVLVNSALDGKYGSSAYESLRALNQYLQVLDLKVHNATEAKSRLLEDTRKRLEKVLESYGDFIDARQHRPKNDKDQAKYMSKVEEKAGKVLATVYEQFDMAHSKTSLLSQRLSALTELDSSLGK